MIAGFSAGLHRSAITTIITTTVLLHYCKLFVTALYPPRLIIIMLLFICGSANLASAFHLESASRNHSDQHATPSQELSLLAHPVQTKRIERQRQDQQKIEVIL
jgi:hypothetical protein